MLALRSSLERIVTASGLGFGDWQWRVSTLPFAFGGLGVYSASDVLNYVFLVSQLLCVGLQTKLLRHTGSVASGPIFDDALSMFNTSMETDLFCNPRVLSTCKVKVISLSISFSFKDVPSSVSTSGLESKVGGGELAIALPLFLVAACDLLDELRV
ncbi:hypothetical protein Tco_1149684 [Tanacetum coccineum]